MSKVLSVVPTELMAALSSYLIVSAEEEQARQQYEGYSWDYHGWTYIERRQKAGEEFQPKQDKQIKGFTPNKKTA